MIALPPSRKPRRHRLHEERYAIRFMDGEILDMRMTKSQSEHYCALRRRQGQPCEPVELKTRKVNRGTNSQT